MADYLGQLVQRVRQPDNAIQPRLSSRFEPPRQARVEVPTVWMPVEQPSHYLRRPIRQLTASRRHRAHESIGGPLSAAALPARCRLTRERAWTSSRPKSRRTPTVATRRIGARPPADVTQRRSRVSGDTPVRRERREAHTVEPVRPRREVESPVPVRRGACARNLCRTHPKGAADRAASQPRRERALAGQSGTSRTDRERRPSARAQSDGLKRRWNRGRSSKWYRRVGLEALRPSASRPTELPDAERSEGPDAPTIHVTIGRVEIRASVAAPVSRKPQARPPAMSLEEYLKQRKGATRE